MDKYQQNTCIVVLYTGNIFTSPTVFLFVKKKLLLVFFSSDILHIKSRELVLTLFTYFFH